MGSEATSMAIRVARINHQHGHDKKAKKEWLQSMPLLKGAGEISQKNWRGKQMKPPIRHPAIRDIVE